MAVQHTHQSNNNQRSLLITDTEDNSWLKNMPHIVPYYCLGNQLRKNDLLQQAAIEHQLKNLGCTKLIVARHISTQNPDHLNLFTDRSYFSFSRGKQRKADLLLKEESSEQLLELEQFVLEQLSILTSYHFIHKGLQARVLSVTGVITFGAAGEKHIYKNGIEFNSVRSSN